MTENRTPESRPRILYLSFNVRYLNPTREHLRTVLQTCADVVLFGPGFQDADVVARGPEPFLQAEGPFDFIVCDEYVIQKMDLTQPTRPRFLNHACAFDPFELSRASEWAAFLKRFSGRRIITLLQSDYYNFSEWQVERLSEVGDFFITWGDELFSEIAPENQPARTQQGVDSEILKKRNDNYRAFARAKSGRIISTPHFVSDKEMFDLPLSRRKTVWSSVGADYSARIVVRETLQSAGLQRSAQWLPRYFSLMQKLGLNPYNSDRKIDFLQWAFRRGVRQSKYAFTCGSALKWPIRKFFEIPANGAVLVCEAPDAFARLGFRDGENAIAIRPEDVLDAHADLERDPGRAQAIATAGHRLVRAHHSIAARSTQVGTALSAILQDRFAGSFWQDGAFKLSGGGYQPKG